jgi:hypothetical protein
LNVDSLAGSLAVYADNLAVDRTRSWPANSAGTQECDDGEIGYRQEALEAKMTRKRKRRESARPRRQRRLHYPIATVAHYGPDDRTVTKIAVGIVEAEGAEPTMERWIGPDVLTNPEIQLQIAGFIQAHGVQQVVTTEGVLGCPHEEGIDFPAGEECPYCPFWSGKQGARAASQIPPADPYRQMKELSRQHTHLLWESA